MSGNRQIMRHIHSDSFKEKLYLHLYIILSYTIVVFRLFYTLSLTDSMRLKYILLRLNIPTTEI